MSEIDYAAFNELQAKIDKEAEGWPTYPMEVSPGFPPMPVPMIPATIAEQIMEKWLQDQP